MHSAPPNGLDGHGPSLSGGFEPLLEMCSLTPEQDPRQNRCSILPHFSWRPLCPRSQSRSSFPVFCSRACSVTIHRADEVQACVADGLVQVREVDSEPVLVALADLAHEILHQRSPLWLHTVTREIHLQMSCGSWSCLRCQSCCRCDCWLACDSSSICSSTPPRAQ